MADTLTTTAATTTNAGTNAATNPTQSTAGTLSGWAAPYVTDLLGKGMAYSGTDFTPYTGDIAAGPSSLESQAFQGIAGLTTPDKGPMDVFTGDVVGRYMNPYALNVISPQPLKDRLPKRSLE